MWKLFQNWNERLLIELRGNIAKISTHAVSSHQRESEFCFINNCNNTNRKRFFNPIVGSKRCRYIWLLLFITILKLIELEELVGFTDYSEGVGPLDPNFHSHSTQHRRGAIKFFSLSICFFSSLTISHTIFQTKINKNRSETHCKKTKSTVAKTYSANHWHEATKYCEPGIHIVRLHV